MIKKILKRKSVKNGAWLYLLQIFNTVVPLLTLPYITRILGAKQYGIFSIAINVIGYYQVVVEYGFAMSATRKVALSDKNSDSLSKTFSTVFFSRCILLMVCFGITVGYIFLNRNQLSHDFNDYAIWKLYPTELAFSRYATDEVHNNCQHDFQNYYSYHDFCICQIY